MNSLRKAAISDSNSSAGTRILIFNQQGQREALSLLEGLFTAIKTQGVVHFDHVIFCTSAVLSSPSAKGRFSLHFFTAH
jgi:hypothetical protein